ncbi:ribonuclease P protein component [Rhodanobacter sp. FDAARGOS 1247]|uniref:ribonuclease P protein component n=1 Tax=Rhodanobacter sp. FDAARGOS 1247 TaxID=2778082 RepID=UPI00194E5B80|nr:ribonuclease P protein component [Rhodanobacter sp. FDAARGOS 1247]QRP63916.1 ribonuclease P protein component [Rhodanobacter sp. FDAARGOS 1247]
MSSAGLPRDARLRRPGDFAALRTSSGRAGGRCFHMRFRENELGHARLGLAISKRVSKRAVERNRIKRLLRESFRRVRHQLPAVDMMVMAREQAAGVPGPQLLTELDALWKKLLAGQTASSGPLKRAGDTTTIER